MCKVVVRFPRGATFLTAIFSNSPFLLSPFLLFLASLRPKRHFFVPVLTFADISPRMNIRWILLDMQNYIYKEGVTFSCATKLSRGESIFFEEAYDFSFSLPIAIVSSRRSVNDRPPVELFSSGDNSKERRDAKEGYQCRGENMNGACENVHAKCSLHNLPAKVVVTLTAISLYNSYKCDRVECCARIA